MQKAKLAWTRPKLTILKSAELSDFLASPDLKAGDRQALAEIIDRANRRADEPRLMSARR